MIRFIPALLFSLATVTMVACSGPSPDVTTVSAVQETTHIVKSGETFSGIADQYDVTFDALTIANPTVNVEHIGVGQNIVIP
jgi:LysM repeat protein